MTKDFRSRPLGFGRRITAGVVLAAALGTGSIAAARDLTVVSWGGTAQDAQREFFFQPFAAQEGITVLEDSWDGGYGVLQSRVAAGSPIWDVVQVEAEEEVLGCLDGIYEPLDWSLIGSKDDFIEGAASDCGVGALTSSTGLAYDANRLPDGPTGWVDFFDTEKFPGKRALRRGPKYTLEFALMGDGVPSEEVYDVLATPEGLDRAFQKLESLGPDLLWWEAGAQPIQLILSGEVAMAASYNGRITVSNDVEGTNLIFVWPGNVMATDSWVILKGSENLEMAQKLVAFMSQPEQQSKFPTKSPYGVPNTKAAALVPPEVERNLPTNADNLAGAVPLDVEFWIDNNETLTSRFNAWLAAR